MAKEIYFTGNNFNTEADGGLKPTTYLNYAGLSALWNKIKTYVDNSDEALAAAAKAKIDANDDAIRKYIESLEINGITVTSDKKEATEGTPGTLGKKLEVEIKGSNIVVGEAGGNDYKEMKVDAAIGDIDSRLDRIKTTLDEGIVSGLIVDVNHGEYTTTTTDEAGEPVTKKEIKAWVSVTEVGTPGTPDIYETGDISITVDDTALNEKIIAIDEEIEDLIANAGVTNIAVKDVNSEGVANKGLVAITLEGSKDPVGVKEGDYFYGDGSRRGNILITLDESALDEKIEDIDAAIAALASATHFIGVTKTALTDGNTTNPISIKSTGGDIDITAVDGDIVITAVAGKEFIFYSGVWYELGDTTSEVKRIGKLEEWVDKNIISSADIGALFTGEGVEAPKFEF